jgi:DNA-binding NtrC family response regulator
MLDVLVVDDDAIVREHLAQALSSKGHHVWEARDGLEALELASSQVFDVAICDVEMPRLDGRTLFRRLRREAPSTSIIIMTSFGNVQDVVSTLRDGASDYVTKPFDPDRFAETVIRPIDERRTLMRRFEEARTAQLDRQAGKQIVAESPAMRALVDRLRAVAVGDAPVLLRGESGTGKTLLAKRLHEQSHRSGGPFVVLPCSELQGILAEADRQYSESRRRGQPPWRPKAGDGGTLVLDGIEQLSLASQAACIRFLDRIPAAIRTHDGHPLGVRFVTLASVRLSDWSSPRLLPGLQYRVSAVSLDVPPLRERPSDLVTLARFALEQMTPAGKATPTIEPRAWTKLSTYAFPGNVSELHEVLQRAMTNAWPGPIDEQHLPAEVTRAERKS